MLTKTITYKNFKGESRTAVHYFNLTYTELLDMEMDVQGGFSARLKDLAEKQDVHGLYPVMKKFITHSWGERSEDGEYFDKDPEKLKHFMSSAAFDALMQELTQSPEDFFTFIWSVVPEDTGKEAKAEFARLTTDEKAEAIKQMIETGPQDTPPPPPAYTPPWEQPTQEGS